MKKLYVISATAFRSKARVLKQLEEWEQLGKLNLLTKVYEIRGSVVYEVVPSVKLIKS